MVALGFGVHEAGPQSCLAQLARLRVPEFVCGLVTSFPSSLFEDPSTALGRAVTAAGRGWEQGSSPSLGPAGRPGLGLPEATLGHAARWSLLAGLHLLPGPGPGWRSLTLTHLFHE